MTWRFVKCESWPCSDYEVAHNMWLCVLKIARDAAEGAKQQSAAELRRAIAERRAVSKLIREARASIARL
jgi:hypothetical protein